MALITCPECGNSVSNRANTCPKCGYPISYSSELVSQKTLAEKEFKFKIANNVITYSEDEAIYLIIHSDFESMAYKIKKSIIEETTQASKKYDLLYDEKMLIMCNKAWGIVIGYAKKYLIETSDIDYISEESLWEHLEEYFDIDTYLKDYIEGRDVVIQFIEELKYKRGMQRNSRSKWTGGGFGIKGALMGAAKASMLNLGTGIIRGIGDSLTDSNDRSRVEKVKSDIVNKGKAYKSFCNTLYQGIRAIGDIVYSIVVKECGLNYCNTWCRADHYYGKVDNTIQMYDDGKYNEKYALQKLCECIENYPMDILAFEVIYTLDSSTKDDILKIADFIGIKEMLMDTCIT